MAEVELQHISKSFGDKKVLKGINLKIQDGEFLTLVGPSGCGKSTLLRIIAGLELQSDGKVELAGKPMDGIRPSKRDLAMVFQSYALYPHLSVFDNIAVPLRMRTLNKWQRLPMARWFIPGVRQKQLQIIEQIKSTAELLGLESMLNSKPGKLSGGQRQRIAVGRAIVRSPKAFLFDEPLSNLDAKLRVHMRSEITSLHEQLDATFIYVTHDQVEAMTMSDRIAVMMDGEIIQLGTATDVYDNPLDIRVAQFIGSPKINLFTATVEAEGYLNLHHSLSNIRVPENLIGKKITIGLRPEKVRLATSNEYGIHGRVVLLENLGSEIFVHISILDQESIVVMRLSRELADDIELKDVITIAFCASDALVFDDKGKRIELNLMPQKEAVNA